MYEELVIRFNVPKRLTYIYILLLLKQVWMRRVHKCFMTLKEEDALVSAIESGCYLESW